MDIQEEADAFATGFGPYTPKAPWSAGAGAAFGQAWEYGPSSSIGRYAELAEAGRGGYAPDIASDMVSPEDLPQASTESLRRSRIPTLTNDQARERIKAAGVQLDIGDGPVPEPALAIMIERAQTRQRREATIASSEISVLSQLGIGLAAGIADPLNVISAFIPVVGPARYASMLDDVAELGGRASVQAGRRALVRARVGAVEGAAGAALLEPFTALAATQEAQDYGVQDALLNIGGGIVLGATLHNIAGSAADLWQGRFSNAPPDADNIGARMTPEMKTAAFVKAADDLIQGNPVDAGSTIARIAREDPKLAERILVSDALRTVNGTHPDAPEIGNLVARQEWWVARLKAAAAERRKKGKSADYDHTQKMREDAGIKPRTTHANASRLRVEYERSVMQTERTRADLQDDADFLSELTGGEFRADELDPAERAVWQEQRAEIEKELASDTAAIDQYYACIAKGI